MDLVLSVVDQHILTPYIYPESWAEDNLLRQLLTLYVLTAVGGWLLYFITASVGYIFLFDKRYKLHPNFLPNQVKQEIAYASWSIPYMAVATVPIFLLEVQGYSKLYMNVETVANESISSSVSGDQSFMNSWAFMLLSIASFLMFTDCLIYWIHRGLHHRLLYKYLHKPHHKWKVPTPYASHSFHPIDGFLQSVPYHIYPFLFPLHKLTYLGLFIFVNVWTVSIHDGDYRVPQLLQPFVNGSAHHTDHHLLYKYNYGQFFTLWDRIGGSFHFPSQLTDADTLLKEVEKQKRT
jgi:lathosterol oxidase